jgi:DNA repair exonuclease SbcCD ATPase subunit
MAKSDKDLPELIRAATALENEIATLEAVSRAARKLPLNSEKNIVKAGKELSQALALQERLGDKLRELAAAMGGMQSRQEAAIVPLAEFASEIQIRMERLEKHLQAYAALGKSAADVTTLVQSESGDRSAIIEQLQARLIELETGARELVEAARADDFPDLVRDADTLKQRVAAVRKRLLS